MDQNVPEAAVEPYEPPTLVPVGDFHEDTLGSALYIPDSIYGYIV